MAAELGRWVRADEHGAADNHKRGAVGQDFLSRDRREHDQPCSLRSAPAAFEAAADRFDVTGTPRPDDLPAGHRVGGGTARELHPQRAAEADEIAGRADMLVRHLRTVARRERFMDIRRAQIAAAVCWTIHFARRSHAAPDRLKLLRRGACFGLGYEPRSGIGRLFDRCL